jgi:hypothetical protein
MNVLPIVLGAFVAQALAMFIDERTFHRRRGLPRWERVGHPLDTMTVLGCYVWLATAKPSAKSLVVYVALVVFSSLFVTKDEPLHARRCSPGEHWVHALLFVLHPMVLLGAGWLWWAGRLTFLVVPLVLTAAFAIYQIVYWNGPWRPR